MQAATFSDAPARPRTRPPRWTMYASRCASLLFVLAYFSLHQLCYCPGYYLELGVLGLFPLLCGPSLYRYLGAAIIVTSLLTAGADRRGAIRERQQIREMRARAEAQTLREHPEQRHSLPRHE